MKHPTLKHLRLSFCASLTLSSALAVAADQMLDTVVVTATRTEQKLADTLTTTTVITRDQIDRMQPEDFTELLRREVGIDFTRSGGKGTTSSLFIRGTNANQVVFLVDGVRINTSSNGAATLELIDLENIDHIEIVRGPAS